MGCAEAALQSSDTACGADLGESEPRTAGRIAEQVDDARVNAIVVAVELRRDMPTGEPGQLATPGDLRLLLHELLSSRLAATLGCGIEVDGLDRVVVIAHSGGYLAAAAAIEAGDVPQITEVVLLDALYGAEEVFARWIQDDIRGFAARGDSRLRWIDLYTCCAGTAETSKGLAHLLAAPLLEVGERLDLDDGAGDLSSAALANPVVFKRVPVGHSEVPRTYVRAIVEAAGLAPLRAP
jgi:pimeloyl-ACP methyl ester carboxylesterase